ncbi:hypothetical protein BJX61DRAFT_548167 [Aspergillus egyptiacus]|nr:hypothetical protein BJX61DRAFT_548167 [Aspergillus egyptiacus]
MIRPRRNWTAEEDFVLKQEVRRAQERGDNISWHEIAAFLPGRTNKDCRKRWYGTAAAKVRKGPWTEAEDERLRRGIERHGTKWAVVASVVGTRLPDQCSKRWSHAINPDIDHSPWTAVEDELLIHNVNKHGHYWQQIVSLYFPGRTSLAAKNRYHILQRRLRNEPGGVSSGIDGSVDGGSWEELLRWPDDNGSTEQIVHSPLITDQSMQSSEYHSSDQYMLDQIARDFSLYNPSSGLDLDSGALEFLPADLNSSTSLDCALPDDISVDDIVRHTPTPAISAMSTPIPPFSPSTDTKSTAVASSPHRRICIQAVCSTDKLGAIFEAVTKSSISAVIKTDD